MSTLLDPRYKNNPSIFEIDEMERNEAALIKEIDLQLNPDRSPPHNITSTSFPDSNNPLASFLSNNIFAFEEENSPISSSQFSAARDEVASYLKVGSEKLN